MYTAYMLIGFILGFMLGAVGSSLLVRNTKRERLESSALVRMKFGALNWGVAVVVALVGFIIENEMHLP